MANNLPDNAFTSRQALDPGLYRVARIRGVPVDTAPISLSFFASQCHHLRAALAVS
ncbi:hypothetical protein [Mycobacterium sp.]|uniref:hypothetical protein n=1 Tax=Mycobacterium sp. TaxID=1785 RepID=UPI003C77231E